MLEALLVLNVLKPKYVQRMSRTGVIFCLVYIMIISACLIMAYSTTDYKGNFVFLQLPLALQLAMLDTFGLYPLLKDISWIGAYFLIGIPTALLLYFLGALIDRCPCCPIKLEYKKYDYFEK